MTRRATTAVATAALLVLVGASACGGGSNGNGGGSATAVTTDVTVYLLRGEQLGVARRTVERTPAVLRAAVTELLAGPTAAEREADLHTAIPPGTELVDVAVADGVATIDLSGTFDDGGGSASMVAGLAQVVFTATAFPTVESVLFRVDGEPVEIFSSEGVVIDGPQTRQDYEAQAPAILVERPAPGDVVTSPLRLSGTANTFEANLQYELLDTDRRALADGFTTATCGTGCRGTFEVIVPFEAPTGPATLVVFESSAKDGSRTHVVEIPLEFG